MSVSGFLLLALITAQPTITLHGTVSITGRMESCVLNVWEAQTKPTGERCGDTVGYADLDSAQVTVKNEAGTILAVTNLQTQSFDPGILALGTGNTRQCSCTMSFTAEVPKAKFYTLKIGRRGEQTIPADDAAKSIVLHIGTGL